MRSITKLFHRRHAPDAVLSAILGLLVVGGLVVLASASSHLGTTQFGDAYYYLKHQIAFGLSLGLVGFFVASRLDYKIWKKLAFPLLLVSIGLLVAVFTPFGLEARNTNRWVALGPFSFQPAEILKITYILYLGAWLSGAKKIRTQSIKTGLIPYVIVSGIIAGLLFMQPATSTVMILLGSGLVVYFFSGVPFKYIAMIIGGGLLALTVLVAITPYRLQRITSYIDGNSDTQGSGYHVNQALIAIGSGGITGVGWGKSTTKVSLLPAPVDDSIFAIAAQELGFIGAGTIVVLFGALVMRLYLIAWKTKDAFGQLLLIGFGTVIAFQSLVNMMAISGLAPLTGVPLPFISYGGTALAIFMTMIGIASNVSANN